MNQNTIDDAVKIATRCAMQGRPVKKVIWIPPQTATDGLRGNFITQYAPQYTASQRPWWEE